ncbi:MAG: 30S ribosomal protein S2 [Planctomycetaceae bacterium]
MPESATAAPPSDASALPEKPVFSAQSLLEAGVHFGHRTSSWNPKMRPYIFGRRNQIHIIDIKETVRGLLRAKQFLGRVVGRGGIVLFVGTKRQAAEPVREAAEACGMPYVTERWLGGTLTNFRTIRSRLQRLEELESLETTGALATYSKKQQSRLMREYKKVHRNLNGLRTLTRLPDVLVIIDPKKEHNAVNEAKILGIRTVALIDTDSDPDLVSLPIPGNDDSIRSIRLMSTFLSDAIAAGKSGLPQQESAKAESDEHKAIPSIG